MNIFDRVNQYREQREERKEIKNALSLDNKRFW
jgi:hypothetical protein